MVSELWSDVRYRLRTIFRRRTVEHELDAELRRGFTAEDRANAPAVIVVSDAMGKALWRGADPLGKCIRFTSDTMPCTTVIGVAENTHARSMTGNGELAYYLPMEQYLAMFHDAPMLAMFVRVDGRPEDFVQAIRSRLQPLMPSPSYVTASPFHEIIDPTMRSWTAGAQMFATFGALALLLAAIGLYAVVAFTVSQRTRELGVRIALGALPRDVVRLVVGEGVRVTITGVVIGVLISLVGARTLNTLLFGVTARDPVVYGAVTIVLVAAAALASAVPASRAARLDPNTALRVD
jgi:hypothetical protein